MSEKSFEQQVIELQDRLAIQEVHNKYVIGMDNKDEEMYMSVWDQDASVDMQSYGKSKGYEDIRKGLHGVWDYLPETHHLMGNVIVLEYDGVNAKTVSCVFSTAWRNDKVAIVSFATYRDKLVKKEGKWLIIDRFVDTAYSAPVKEVWDLR